MFWNKIFHMFGKCNCALFQTWGSSIYPIEPYFSGSIGICKEIGESYHAPDSDFGTSSQTRIWSLQGFNTMFQQYIGFHSLIARIKWWYILKVHKWWCILEVTTGQPITISSSSNFRIIVLLEEFSLLCQFLITGHPPGQLRSVENSLLLTV